MGTVQQLLANFWPLILLPVMMYLFARPENKRRKEREEMRNELKSGDEITTVGGMVGKVVHVKGELITFETGEDRVRIQIVKNAVSARGKDITTTPGE